VHDAGLNVERRQRPRPGGGPRPGGASCQGRDRQDGGQQRTCGRKLHVVRLGRRQVPVLPNGPGRMVVERHPPASRGRRLHRADRWRRLRQAAHAGKCTHPPRCKHEQSVGRTERSMDRGQVEPARRPGSATTAGHSRRHVTWRPVRPDGPPRTHAVVSVELLGSSPPQTLMSFHRHGPTATGAAPPHLTCEREAPDLVRLWCARWPTPRPTWPLVRRTRSRSRRSVPPPPMMRLTGPPTGGRRHRSVGHCRLRARRRPAYSPGRA
jgi:hypothetical protein